MVSETITIVLDSPNNCFYAGTNVTGEVVVNSDKSMDIRGLSLKIHGGAHVSWEESQTERNATNPDGTTREETRHVSYHSDEEYFSNKYNLLGETTIPVGRNSYRFSSPLPPLLPSSFNGEYGYVKYTVKATIDRAWKFDQDAKLEFKVIAPLDMNYNPVAREPIRKEKQKTFCCWCCASAPFVMNLSIPYSGFVPGQPIPITIDAENGSNVDINSITIKLNKTIKWICQRPSKSEKDTTTEIAKVTLEGCPQRGSRNLSHNLTIPEMPVNNLEGCSVIKVSYQLRVEGETSGCHNNPSIKVPILIGSVPIAGTFSGMPSDPASSPQEPIPAYPSQQMTYPGQQLPFPAQPGYPAQPSFPAQSPGFPSQPSFPAQSPGYPSQPTFPAQQPGYPSQPAVPAQQPGYQPQPPFPAQQMGYPSQPAQLGYPTDQSMYPTLNPTAPTAPSIDPQSNPQPHNPIPFGFNPN